MALKMQDRVLFDELTGQLQAAVVRPHIYVKLLESCGVMGGLSLTDGKRIHNHMVENGHAKHPFLSNHVLLMYERCNSFGDVHEVFKAMQDRNVLSWNTMVRAFARQGLFEEAISCFQSMLQDGTRADRVACLSLLKAPRHYGQATRTYDTLCAVGIDESRHVFIATAIIGMFGKCGGFEDAMEVFERIPDPGTVPWNALMTVFSKAEQDLHEGVMLFRRMLLQGVKPNVVSFVCASKACASLGVKNVEDLRMVHRLAVEGGFVDVVYVANSIMHAYDKCKCLEDAKALFEKMVQRDATSWNTIIAANAQSGHLAEAFRLYERLRAGPSGIVPDSISFVNVLEACDSTEELALGEQIHLHVKDAGFENNVVVATALMSMYRRCGNLKMAMELFTKINRPCVITWNAIIAAHAQYGDFLQGLQLFRTMLLEGVVPSEFTFITVLSSCADKATVSAGRAIHGWILESPKYQDSVFLDNTLIDMYGKAGCLRDASNVFNSMSKRSVASWNSVINAYAQHGHSDEAISFFQEMQQFGFHPDEFTYTAVLSASNNNGLLEEGCQIYYGIGNDYSGIKKGVEHYGCIVALLGRRGCLAEAERFLLKAFNPLADVPAWMSLLDACKIYGDNDMALRAAEHVVRLEPNHAGCYTTLSNLLVEKQPT